MIGPGGDAPTSATARREFAQNQLNLDARAREIVVAIYSVDD